MLRVISRVAITVSVAALIVGHTLAQGGRAGGAAAPAAAQAAPNPLAAPPQAGTSAISGVAIDGLTNQPLAGVVVYLGPPQHGPPGQPIRQITDAKGRFVFTHLPAYDGYFINASKFGYLEGHYGRASSGQLGARIGAAQGQWVSDIRVVMDRPGSIAGTVLDDHGDPIVGAFVRVLRQVPVSGEMQMAAGFVATTDDRGMYRIPNLVPGKYYVQMPSVQNAVPSSTTIAALAGLSPQAGTNLEANGRQATFADPIIDVDATNQLIVGRYPIPPRSADGAARVYPITFHPAATNLSGASTVVLAAGENRPGIDLRVSPVAGRRISGRIDGPEGLFAGLTIRLVLAGVEDLGDGGEAATALIGPEGGFTFINVPAGAYVLDLRDSVGEYQYRGGVIGGTLALPRTPAIQTSGSGSYGVLSSPVEGLSMSYRQPAKIASMWVRQPISVEGRDVTSLVLTPRKASSISGRYVFEGARPLGELGGLALQPARGQASLGVRRSRNNTAGLDTFLIEGLLPGEYVVDSLFRVKSIVCEGRDYTYRPFDVSEGHDFSDCIVTLTDKSITVTGSARDDSGQGRSEIGVIFFPAEREQWTGFGFTPKRIKSIQVSNTGFFRFQSLPEGDYCAIAVPAALVNAWLEPGFLELAAAQATRLHLSWGDVVTQDLKVKAIKWPK